MDIQVIYVNWNGERAACVIKIQKTQGLFLFMGISSAKTQIYNVNIGKSPLIYRHSHAIYFEI
ncbi:hypothetical protein EDD58_105150 [Hazenella coriacea]|uniref:Uncharacterized protein n=1 Tax=Hazenella coriacea TaxID=1179467 RepID=A0A4R3L362_9BACL|nr:hypothetical protein EDD58_105150 [Hazenella coriacea]